MHNTLPYPYLNLLIYPTTACNLRCKYCFHADGDYKTEFMSKETLDRLFRLLFPKYEYLQFIWHGGEPLCTGLSFFKDAVQLEQQYKEQYGTEIDNGLMTNGTLVDDETARFFSSHNFDVGISFDGIHNEELRGSTDKVIQGIHTLNRHSCNPDIVTVITNSNLSCQVENYEYMKQFQCEVKFNPVAPIGGGKENPASRLDAEIYIEKCREMFDYWLADLDNPIMLEPYYYYLRDIKKNTSSGCQRTSCLGRWVAVHPNGDIYPCVRENRPEYRFGNIWEIEDISEIWQSDTFFALLEGSIERRQACADCPWYQYCQGGCTVNAITEKGIKENGGFSCVTFKGIFSYVYQRYEEILKMSAEEIEKINPIVRELLFP